MTSFKKIALYPITVLLLILLSNIVYSSAYAYLDLMMIRWIQYLSGAVYVGLLFFQLCILPKGSLKSAMLEKRYLQLWNLSFVFFLISTLFSMPLQSAIESGLFRVNGWNPSSLKSFLNLLIGAAWIVQLIILLLLSIIQLLQQKFTIAVRWISFSLGICLMAVTASTGHAFYAPNHVLSMIMDFFHLFSISIWVGSVTAMVTLLPLRKNETGKIFFRGIIHLFTPWGAAALIILTITGVYGSLLYIPTINSLLNTSYGRVFIGKMALCILMIVFSILPFLQKKKQGTEWGLALWSTVITGLAVLVLAAFLTILQPPI